MDFLKQLLAQPLAVNVLVIVGEVALTAVLFWLLGRVLGGAVNLVAGAGPSADSEEPSRVQQIAARVRRNLRMLLILSSLLTCIAVAGLNGYLVYRGEYLPEYTLAKLRSIPPGFWGAPGLGLAKVAGLAAVTYVVLRILRRPIRFACQRAKDFEGITSNDSSLDQLFAGLERTLVRGGWLGALTVSTVLLGLSPAITAGLVLILKIYLLIGLGILCWRALNSAIESLDALSQKYSESKGLLNYYERLESLVPILRRTLEYVIFLGTATLVAHQVETTATLAEWGPRLMQVLGILFLSRVFVEVVRLLVEEVLIKRAELDPDQRQRRLTIVPLIQSVLSYIIYFAAFVLALKAVGIDPLPILAGAGVVGLAIGLGAQSLVNDVLSGFFILFENYYLVGDHIRAGEAEGTVEAIDIRTTRIRDGHGQVHILRNGQIDKVVNCSKGYVLAVVEVGVAYESDLDEVYRALEALGRELQQADPDVLEVTQVQGVESFGESEVVLRTVTKVRPGKHKGVERRFRKEIKDRFDELGISIPYAQRVVTLRSEADPEPAAAVASV